PRVRLAGDPRRYPSPGRRPRLSRRSGAPERPELVAGDKLHAVRREVEERGGGRVVDAVDAQLEDVRRGALPAAADLHLDLDCHGDLRASMRADTVMLLSGRYGG